MDNHHTGGGTHSSQSQQSQARHSAGAHHQQTSSSSNKASKSSTAYQTSMNLQHMIQLQSAKESYKSQTALQYNNTNSSGSNKAGSGKPPMMTSAGVYDTSGVLSSASTPNAAASSQQQRALTQLYQQSQQTPLSSSKHHHGSSAKGYTANSSSAHHQSSKQSAKAMGGSSTMSKKESATKQVDLQAKFASLLKQSKDLQKERDSLSKYASASQITNSGKQDKKGEKRDGISASIARNQLFGEASSAQNNKASSKGADNNLQQTSSKQTKEQQQLHQQQAKQLSPMRQQANLRQTPVNQQMLIVQNTQGSSPQGPKHLMNTIAMKTFQNQGQNQSPMHAPNASLGKTQTIFPRQASQTIPSTLAEGLLQGPGSRSQIETGPNNREASGRASQQFGSNTGARATSNSQTRSKKKSRVSNASSNVYRPSASGNVQSDVNIPLNSQSHHHQTETQGPRGLSGNRSSQITTGSTKSKKKKQQPSQQQTNIDPVEEYLTNAARLSQQMQTLNQIPAAERTPLVRQEVTPTNAARTEARQESEPGFSAVALSSINSGSMRQLIDNNTNTLDLLENQLFTQFKSKCQQEIQSQTKQAVAKLLYTKREILLELKAIQATMKQSVVVTDSHRPQSSQQSSARKLTENSQTVNNNNPASNANNIITTKTAVASAAAAAKQREETLLQQCSSIGGATSCAMTEPVVKELIKQSLLKFEQGFGASYKAEIQANNEHLEERIDDILVQIQQIISGLEDTIYDKIGKIETDNYSIGQEVQQIKSLELEQMAQKAHDLAAKASSELSLLDKKIELSFVTKTTFDSQVHDLKSTIDEKIVTLPQLPNKNTDDFPLNDEQLSQVSDMIQELQTYMDKENIEARDQTAKEIDERLNEVSNELQQMVNESLQDAWQGFENLATTVKDDVQQFVKKEFVAKEANIQSKIEQNKQQFLKAINGNMRILDNLISDYTTRTRDQIKTQLRTGSSSRQRVGSSQRLHTSNQDQDMEELQSMQASSVSNQSQAYRQRLGQKALEAITAQSLQIQGSLSSVQDVSGSIKQQNDDEVISSQLLSTARDKLLQQELAQATNGHRIKGIINNASITSHLSRVPQLNINGMMPSIKQSSNSERLLSQPQQTFMQQQQCSTTSHDQANNDDEHPDENINRSGNRSGNPPTELLDKDYSTPQKAFMMDSFQTVNQQNNPNNLLQVPSNLGSRQEIIQQEPHRRNRSREMIIVEEHKFTQSQEETSSQVHQHQTPQLDQDNHESPESSMPLSLSQEVIPNRSNHGSVRMSSKKTSKERRQEESYQNIDSEEAKDVANDLDDGQNDEKQNQEEHRQMMEGDLQERSMDQIQMQVAQGNVLPMDMRKSQSDIVMTEKQSKASSSNNNNANKHYGFKRQETDPRLRNGGVEEMINVNVMRQGDMIREELDVNGEQQIEFTLSTNSPYHVKSGGPVGLEDSNSYSISGTMQNFGYKTVNGTMINSRSQSMHQSKAKSNTDKGGAVSMRVQNVVSPVQQIPISAGHTLHKTGSSVYKQENTDSEFWNLTADDESQIDPVMVMRNLSNTNLCSGATSMIQIQEADNKTPTLTQQSTTVKQSFQSYCNDGRPGEDDEEPNPQKMQATRAHQLLEIDHYSRDNSQAILNEEPIEVHLIQNDGKRIRGDHAHIQEFTPVTSTPMDMQRSYQNTDDEQDDGQENDQQSSSADQPQSSNEGGGGGDFSQVTSQKTKKAKSLQKNNHLQSLQHNEDHHQTRAELHQQSAKGRMEKQIISSFASSLDNDDNDDDQNSQQSLRGTTSSKYEHPVSLTNSNEAPDKELLSDKDNEPENKTVVQKSKQLLAQSLARSSSLDSQLDMDMRQKNQAKKPKFTMDQARRSSNIPIMEERPPAAGRQKTTVPQKQSQLTMMTNGQQSVLLDTELPVFKSPTTATSGTISVKNTLAIQEQQSCLQSQMISNQQNYTRGKKPGSDLPPSLQRQGNEIIHQILLDEVIGALDEVIHLSRDQLNEIILGQQNAITISNRNLITSSRTMPGTRGTRMATHLDDGVMLDNSDRYELSEADEQSLQIDQSAEQLPSTPDSQNPNMMQQAQDSQEGEAQNMMIDDISGDDLSERLSRDSHGNRSNMQASQGQVIMYGMNASEDEQPQDDSLVQGHRHRRANASEDYYTE